MSSNTNKVIFDAKQVISTRNKFQPISQYQLNQYLLLEIEKARLLNPTGASSLSGLFNVTNFNIRFGTSLLYTPEPPTLYNSFVDENDNIYISGVVKGTYMGFINSINKTIPNSPTVNTYSGFVNIYNSTFIPTSQIHLVPTVPTDASPRPSGFRLLRDSIQGNRLVITVNYVKGFKVYINNTLLTTISTPAVESFRVFYINMTNNTLITTITPTIIGGRVHIGADDTIDAKLYSPLPMNLPFNTMNNGVVALITLSPFSTVTWDSTVYLNATANKKYLLTTLNYSGGVVSTSPLNPTVGVCTIYNIETNLNGDIIVSASTKSSATLFGASLVVNGPGESMYQLKCSSSYSYDWSNFLLSGTATGLGNIPITCFTNDAIDSAVVLMPKNTNNISVTVGNTNITTSSSEFLLLYYIDMATGLEKQVNTWPWDGGNSMIHCAGASVDTFGNTFMVGTFKNLYLPSVSSINVNTELFCLTVNAVGTVTSYLQVHINNLPTYTLYPGISIPSNTNLFYTFQSTSGNSSSGLFGNAVTIIQPTDGNTYTNTFLIQYGVTYL